MREFVLRGVAYTLLSGCFFDATGESAGEAGLEDDDTEDAGDSGSATGPTTGAPSTGASGPTTQDPSSSTTASTDGPDETTDAETTDGPSETTDAPGETCPEQLPDGWILCEDFEHVEDPAEHFAIWGSYENTRLRVDEAQAHTGEFSLAAEHDPMVSWAGTAWIRFGAGPMETPWAPSETFEEVWLRAYLYLDDGWDVGGLGDLIEINSVTTGFAHVASASIDALPGSNVFRARARTCVSGPDTINCDGNMDYQTLSDVANAPGTTTFFDGSNTGAWHCLVVHARLNAIGAADGELQLELDGALEAELMGVDFRHSFPNAGFNAIQMSAFREGGSPHDVRRYVDDIVVSAQPLDCE